MIWRVKEKSLKCKRSGSDCDFARYIPTHSVGVVALRPEILNFVFSSVISVCLYSRFAHSFWSSFVDGFYSSFKSIIPFLPTVRYLPIFRFSFSITPKNKAFCEIRSQFLIVFVIWHLCPHIVKKDRQSLNKCFKLNFNTRAMHNIPLNH